MIKFHKVRFKNFGSFGNNYTEVQLDRHQRTLISGFNGHGKSFALLDSITFALFGKPFRKINIPQLVNSLNEKECIVELEFEAGGDEYLIRRGLKPKVFEVFKNNDLVDIAAKSKDYQRMLEGASPSHELQVVHTGCDSCLVFVRAFHATFRR